MRELQVCPPTKQKPAEQIVRLQFDSTSEKLVAWSGYYGTTNTLWTCTLASGATEVLSAGEDLDEHAPSDAAPAVSSDLRLIARELLFADSYSVHFFNPANQEQWFLTDSALLSSGGLVFTPDEKELLAVRNLTGRLNKFEPDIVRCKVSGLAQRSRLRLNWQSVATLKRGEYATAVGIAPNGRSLAVGRADGSVDIVDVKRKTPERSFPWKGQKLRDRAVIRVGFDPTSQWVVMLANGRLFARTLDTDDVWQTKTTQGYAHDFAFHPTGQILVAVFKDGQARYLNPLTGAVKQSFRWGKKPLYSVAFSPDGLMCAAGGEKGKVVIWDVDA